MKNIERWDALNVIVAALENDKRNPQIIDVSVEGDNDANEVFLYLKLKKGKQQKRFRIALENIEEA